MHALERWIRDHGMNKADACRWLGVSRPTLNRWFDGHIPQSRHVKKIIEKTKGEITAEIFFSKPRRRANG